MLSKLLAYLFGTSLILLGIGGVALKIEHSRLAKAKQATADLQQKYDNLNSEYELYKTLQGINSMASSKYEQESTKDESVKQTLLSKVDETTKQVNDHEITSSDADVSYTHSMWDAYCQAISEASPDCTSK